MTKGEALKLVTYLTAAYPRPEVSPETIEVYMENLLDLPYETTQHAVTALLRTAKFLPSISEIRAAVTIAARGPRHPTPGDAWARVLFWVRKIGGYGTVPTATPSDRLIARCIAAVGGWEYLCHETENIMADRAHFLRVYAENVQRERETSAESTWAEHGQITDERTAARVAAILADVVKAVP